MVGGLLGVRLVLGAGRATVAPMLLLSGAAGLAFLLSLVASPSRVPLVPMLDGAGGAGAPALLGGVAVVAMAPLVPLVLVGAGLAAVSVRIGTRRVACSMMVGTGGAASFWMLVRAVGGPLDSLPAGALVDLLIFRSALACASSLWLWAALVAGGTLWL